MRSSLRLAVFLLGIAIFTCFADDVWHLFVVAIVLGWRSAVRYAIPVLGAFAEHSALAKFRRLAIIAIPALGTLRIWFRFHTKRYRAWWKGCSPRKKLLLAFIPAVIAAFAGMFSGLLLGLLAVFSTGIPGLAEYVLDRWPETVLRGARRAAMRTAEPWFDEVWQRVPEKPRAFMERRYSALWFRTMLRIARNRRKAERRVRRQGIIIVVWAWIYVRAFKKARKS